MSRPTSTDPILYPNIRSLPTTANNSSRIQFNKFLMSNRRRHSILTSTDLPKLHLVTLSISHKHPVHLNKQESK